MIIYLPHIAVHEACQGYGQWKTIYCNISTVIAILTHPRLNQHRRIVQEKIYRNPQFGDKKHDFLVDVPLNYLYLQMLKVNVAGRGHPSKFNPQPKFQW